MPAAPTANETLRLTLSLPPAVAKYIRDQVASGIYANETEYVESILLSDALFEPIDQERLTPCVETEGARCLGAVKADPPSALTSEEVFESLDMDDEPSEDSNLPNDPGLEHWIQTVGVARYDAYDANPSDVYTSDDVRRAVAERRAALDKSR
jgi:Arc/MetJ-type ribon-helix-helix transcriptional regulator